MLAGIATSPSRIHNPLLGEDCRSTWACLTALGIKVNLEDGVLCVEPAPWSAPSSDLDCGNSGTTARLISGLLASRDGLSARLVGDASLSRRPMRRVIEPLRRMGADLEGETLPLRIRGAKLHGIHHESPVASAQVKSAVLLAGLRAEGETVVSEPHLSRDHTERMLTSLGVPLWRDGLTVGIRAAELPGFEFTVPADISSAAFWLVAASGLPGSELTLTNVGLNPTRTGILDVLEQAGVDCQITLTGEELGEPVGDITLIGPERLRPFEVRGDLVPRLIDEIPVLAVLATQCQGVSEFRDAAELKVKESDRVAETASMLNAMGAKVEALEDGLRVHGPTPLTGARVEAHGDHRMAMSALIAGLFATSGATSVTGADTIATSYPEFMDHLEAIVVR